MVFSSFLAKIQRISTHYYKGFCAETLKSQLFSAHFLNNIWKISRPGSNITEHEKKIWTTKSVNSNQLL